MLLWLRVKHALCVLRYRLMVAWMRHIKAEWDAEGDDDAVDYSDF